MATSISDIYRHSFFKKHQSWQIDYISIADMLCRQFNFTSVLDVGCGNAYIIERLRTVGKQVCGIEGSKFAFDCMPPAIADAVVMHDLTKPIMLGQFDLVICTEVAEHLRAEESDALLSAICNHAPKSIFFTAATPGQRGRCHWNEQPNDYWIGKLKMLGYHLSEQKTREIREELGHCLKHTRWIAKNALAFARAT